MEKIPLIAIFLVLVIIFIIIMIWMFNTVNPSLLLTGFYQAPPVFCEKAGIDSFLLYIDTNSISSRSDDSHTGYILSAQDQTILINELIDFTVKWENKSLKKIISDGYVCGKWNMTKIPQIPQTMDIKFYPILGKIILHDDDTTYAIVYRSPETTELIKVNNNGSNIGDGDIEKLAND